MFLLHRGAFPPEIRQLRMHTPYRHAADENAHPRPLALGLLLREPITALRRDAEVTLL
jgi:hypothetical protein